MGRFFPIELREAKSKELINLMIGNMTAQEYGLKFNQICRYALHMVSYSRAQMYKFLYELSDLMKIM